MPQPIWRVVSISDAFCLLVDTTGVYPAECERVEEIDDDGDYVELYRVVLDKLKLDPVQLELFEKRPGFGHHLRLVDVIDDKGVAHAPWFEDDVHDANEGKPGHCAGYFGYCPRCERWVSGGLTSAAECSDVDPDKLRRDFCSDSPKVRMRAYETIACYHGWNNFDAYPQRLLADEVAERWRRKHHG